MLEIAIPGRDNLILQHLVCDVNGTLAVDGQLIPGVADLIHALQPNLTIHLITANTHGRQAEIDAALGTTAVLVEDGYEAEQKAAFVRSLGNAATAAIGQGANDLEMLKEAALGICVLSPEGTFVPSLLGSDLVFPDIFSALGFFHHPTRITATLRR
jgi:P-type E1-E2 ATPase